MLEYDPDKRITAREALRHKFFRVEPALPAVDLRASASDELAAPAPEKEPSISHAEPANAAVVGLRTSGKPGSSQVQSDDASCLFTAQCPQGYPNHIAISIEQPFVSKAHMKSNHLFVTPTTSKLSTGQSGLIDLGQCRYLKVKSRTLLLL